MSNDLYDKLSQREEDLKSGKISKEDVVDSLQQAGLLGNDSNVVELPIDEESEGWGEHVAELFQKRVDKVIHNQHELSLITGTPFNTYQYGYLVEIRVIGKLPQNPSLVVEKGTRKARSPETVERFKQLKSVSMEELAANYKEVIIYNGDQ